MLIPFINLKSQYKALKPSIDKKVDKVMRHGKFIMGPEVVELEDKLKNYVKSKHCITVSSGTDALLLSLMALGIGRGDEVITSVFSFISVAEVIVLLGAKPVFVDIEPDTCNINVKLIKQKISKKTKAIIPVSLYGQIPDMDEINEIAKKSGNIPVIEDAAQSFGATYKNKKSCNLSTIGCTSFFPSKPLGCYGDGGAIFTNNLKIAKICRELREHGQSRRYVHKRVGLGARMDTLQCAILLTKLERFDLEVKKRNEIAKRYNFEFDKFNLKRVIQKADRTSVFAQYSIFVNNRNKFQKELKKKNIPTTVHYPLPIGHQSAYKNYCCTECTLVAEKISKKIISIPMSADLAPQHQKLIIKEILNFF
jgi:UDP-2-acetamido-2-deoxy-ribo-hexuluronate aminotransferase